jgi:hypothetical protein
MKWMLVVLVFEVAPVKTGLIYDDLGACLAAEETVRQAYANAYNAQNEWARQNLETDEYHQQETFLSSRLLRNPATCIPYAALPENSN